MSKRDVNLRINVDDRDSSKLTTVETQLRRLARAQKAVAERRTGHSETRAELDRLQAAYEKAARAAEAAGRRFSALESPTERQSKAFERSRRAARSAQDSYLAAAAAMSKATGKASSFALWDRGVEAGVRRMTPALDKAAVTQARLAAATDRAAAANRRFAATATAATGAANAKAAVGFLGLQGHQLANLSYQVNDVVSGLAMGQKPMMILAQQGGQILQIFPKVISTLARMAPVLAPLAAALSPVIAGFARLRAESASLKAFDVALTAMGDGARYNAAAMAKVAGELRRIGFSAEEANTALIGMARRGVDPALLQRFGQAARDLSKVTGETLAKSVETVTDAFTGNADAILALDDQLAFLSAAERKQITAMRDSKREAEARTTAFGIFESQMGDAAAKMGGTWSDAARNLGRTWDWMVQQIADSEIIRNTIKELQALADLVKWFTGKLPGAQQRTLSQMWERRGQVDQELVSTENALAGARSTSSFNGPSRSTLEAQRRRLLDERRTLMREIAELGERVTMPPMPRDTTTRPPSPSSTSTASRGQSEAEKLVEAQRDYDAGIRAANAAREFEISLLGQAAREAEILAAIETARAQAAEPGLTFSDAQAEAIRKSVGALYDARTEQEAFEAVSRDALELARQRGEVEEKAAFVRRRLAEENLTAESALYAIRADQFGQLWDIEAAARRRAEVEGQVNAALQRRAELQRQLELAETTGDTGRAAELRAMLDDLQIQLPVLIDAALEFWATAGGPEAEAAILRLQGYRAEVTATGRELAITRRAAEDLANNSAMSAFDQLTSDLAEGRNALAALGSAFRQFVADFLSGIAKMLAQRAFMQIFASLVPGFGGIQIGSAGPSLVKAPVKHDGGMVGEPGPSRNVWAESWASIKRFHNGGVIGLKSGEVPIVAERGEEVLTMDDPRHALNGGGSRPVVNMKNINLFDPADMLNKGLSTEEGVQSLLNVISENPRAFRAAMG